MQQPGQSERPCGRPAPLRAPRPIRPDRHPQPRFHSRAYPSSSSVGRFALCRAFVRRYPWEVRAQAANLCQEVEKARKPVAMAPVWPHSSRQSTRRGQRVIRRIFNYRKVPYAEMRAFSVHLLTASGSFLAFLGVVAAAESRFIDMFWWLGLALAVDGIDGPIARKVGVKEVLQNWSGDTLDNIIDYVTYVLLPAFALYQSGMIGEPWSFVAAGMIVVSSAIYYADTGMKTDEYFFSGFPVVWNMVIFPLFVIQASATTALIVVSISVFLTFLPINFLHPVRVKRLRPLNLAEIGRAHV